MEVFNDLGYLFLKKVYDETIISNYYINKFLGKKFTIFK